MSLVGPVVPVVFKMCVLPTNTFFFMQKPKTIPKLDSFGRFYDHLPDEFKIATLDDFHLHGKKNLGMVFLVLWNDEVRYSYHQVNHALKAQQILPFINEKKVFVLKG
jgi:hypothetical protein